MYRSILAVACAVLAVSCVKTRTETPGPGTDTPDVSHFQTAEQYTVPTKAGQITTVKMNGVTLAEASSPMKIWIPRYARTKAAAAPEVIYTPADEYPNGFAGNKAQLFQVVCFEDSRSGDYDYNDLVIHVKYQWNGTRFGFGVHPIALGSTKEVRLGAVVYKGFHAHLQRAARTRECGCPGPSISSRRPALSIPAPTGRSTSGSTGG